MPFSGLYVNEIYRSIQGEGPMAGRTAIFLRTMGCNLTCSWCDTWYTWDYRRANLKDELHKMSINELKGAIEGQTPKHHDWGLVITGGEPMLQQKPLSELIIALRKHPVWINIETNGTILPQQEFLKVLAPWLYKSCTERIVFIVSPKLKNSGNKKEKRHKASALKSYALLAQSGFAAFKFVVETEEDFNEIDSIVSQYSIPDSSVWVMPQATTPKDYANTGKAIYGAIQERGWRLSPRLHVFVWGEMRGV